MRRRSFIRKTAMMGAAMVSGLPLARIHARSQDELRYVLRGAKCFYEGTWQTPDVGINVSGKIKIGPAGSLQGNEIIDATNKILSPGFIDILADNAANPEKTYGIFEKYKISDGVTTALQMHGGSPSCAAYYKSFDSRPHRINFGVSTSVMRIRYGTYKLSDRKMKVEQCLEEGALGVSHSIEYQPTSYEETLEYAKLAKKYSRPFFLHLRYSSKEQELVGVDEAIRIAKESGAHVHIDHLHSTGGTFHMAAALQKIEDAISGGLSMTCCVYPYSFWATYLHSKRFDDGWQQRYGLTYKDLRLVGSGEALTKESFARYRELKKLVAVPEGLLPFAETVDLALAKDFCMIGSDGGIEHEPRANSHPRGAGCFSTAVRHGIAIGLPMEKILEKLTTLPRSLILPAMKDRGVIANGAWADLTIFDAGKINGRATVANPNQFSEGIEMVFVSGVPAFKNGTLLAENGRSIRNNIQS